MTTPSTDDEREALVKVLEWHITSYEVRSILADTILASDVWRNRQPGPIPSVDEFTATLSEVRAHQIAGGYDAAHDDEHGIRRILNWAIDYARRGRSDDSAGMIVAALELLDRQGPITDAQVEAAARALWENDDYSNFDTSWAKVQHAYRVAARAALEAARDSS